MFIETQHPSVYHSRDVWHKAKLSKSIGQGRYITITLLCVYFAIEGWENMQHEKD